MKRKEIKLKLKEDSWDFFLGNVTIAGTPFQEFTQEDCAQFDNIRKYLTDQFEMCTSQGVVDVDEIIDPAQIDLFNQQNTNGKRTSRTSYE